MKLIVLIWVIGACFCVIITAVLVFLAYEIRGKWAWGGEYCVIPVIFLICYTLTNDIREKFNKDKESDIGKNRKTKG